MSSKKEGQIEIKAEEDKNEGTPNLAAPVLAKDVLQNHIKDLVLLEKNIVKQRLDLSECDKMLAAMDGDNDTITELLKLSDGIKQSIDKLEAEIIEVHKSTEDFKL